MRRRPTGVREGSASGIASSSDAGRTALVRQQVESGRRRGVEPDVEMIDTRVRPHDDSPPRDRSGSTASAALNPLSRTSSQLSAVSDLLLRRSPLPRIGSPTSPTPATSSVNHSRSSSRASLLGSAAAAASSSAAGGGSLLPQFKVDDEYHIGDDTDGKKIFSSGRPYQLHAGGGANADSVRIFKEPTREVEEAAKKAAERAEEVARKNKAAREAAEKASRKRAGGRGVEVGAETVTDIIRGVSREMTEPDRIFEKYKKKIEALEELDQNLNKSYHLRREQQIVNDINLLYNSTIKRLKIEGEKITIPGQGLTQKREFIFKESKTEEMDVIIVSILCLRYYIIGKINEMYDDALKKLEVLQKNNSTKVDLIARINAVLRALKARHLVSIKLQFAVQELMSKDSKALSKISTPQQPAAPPASAAAASSSDIPVTVESHRGSGATSAVAASLAAREARDVGLVIETLTPRRGVVGRAITMVGSSPNGAHNLGHTPERPNIPPRQGVSDVAAPGSGVNLPLPGAAELPVVEIFPAASAASSKPGTIATQTTESGNENARRIEELGNNIRRISTMAGESNDIAREAAERLKKMGDNLGARIETLGSDRQLIRAALDNFGVGLESLREELTAEIARATAEERRLSSETQKFRDEASALVGEERERAKEAEQELLGKFTDQKATLTTLQTQLREIQQKQVDSEEEARSAKESQEEREQKVKGMLETIQELRSSLEESQFLREQTAEQRDIIIEEQRGIREEQTQANEQISDFASRLIALEESIRSFLEQQKAALDRLNSESESKKAEFEGRISEVEARIRGQIEEAQARQKEELAQASKRTQQQLQTSKDERMKELQELQALQERIRKLSEAQIRQEQEANRRNDELEEKNRELNSSFDALGQTLADLQAVQAGAGDKAGVANETLVQLQREIEKINAQEARRASEKEQRRREKAAQRQREEEERAATMQRLVAQEAATREIESAQQIADAAVAALQESFQQRISVLDAAQGARDNEVKGLSERLSKALGELTLLRGQQQNLVKREEFDGLNERLQTNAAALAGETAAREAQKAELEREIAALRDEIVAAKTTPQQAASSTRKSADVSAMETRLKALETLRIKQEQSLQQFREAQAASERRLTEAQQASQRATQQQLEQQFRDSQAASTEAAAAQERRVRGLEQQQEAVQGQMRQLVDDQAASARELSEQQAASARNLEAEARQRTEFEQRIVDQYQTVQLLVQQLSGRLDELQRQPQQPPQTTDKRDAAELQRLREQLSTLSAALEQQQAANQRSAREVAALRDDVARRDEANAAALRAGATERGRMAADIKAVVVANREMNSALEGIREQFRALAGTAASNKNEASQGLAQGLHELSDQLTTQIDECNRDMEDRLTAAIEVERQRIGALEGSAREVVSKFEARFGALEAGLSGHSDVLGGLAAVRAEATNVDEGGLGAARVAAYRRRASALSARRRGAASRVKVERGRRGGVVVNNEIQESDTVLALLEALREEVRSAQAREADWNDRLGYLSSEQARLADVFSQKMSEAAQDQAERQQEHSNTVERLVRERYEVDQRYLRQKLQEEKERSERRRQKLLAVKEKNKGFSNEGNAGAGDMSAARPVGLVDEGFRLQAEQLQDHRRRLGELLASGEGLEARMEAESVRQQEEIARLEQQQARLVETEREREAKLREQQEATESGLGAIRQRQQEQQRQQQSQQQASVKPRPTAAREVIQLPPPSRLVLSGTAPGLERPSSVAAAARSGDVKLRNILKALAKAKNGSALDRANRADLADFVRENNRTEFQDGDIAKMLRGIDSEKQSGIFVQIPDGRGVDSIDIRDVRVVLVAAVKGLQYREGRGGIPPLPDVMAEEVRTLAGRVVRRAANFFESKFGTRGGDASASQQPQGRK